MKDEEHKQLRKRVELADVCKRRMGYLVDLSKTIGNSSTKAILILKDGSPEIRYAEDRESVQKSGMSGMYTIPGTSEFMGLLPDMQAALKGVVEKYLAKEREELEKI